MSSTVLSVFCSDSRSAQRWISLPKLWRGAWRVGQRGHIPKPETKLYSPAITIEIVRWLHLTLAWLALSVLQECMTDSNQRKSIDYYYFLRCTISSLFCFLSRYILLNLHTHLYDQENVEGSTLQVMQMAIISAIEIKSRTIRTHHGCGMFGSGGLAEVPEKCDVLH